MPINNRQVRFIPEAWVHDCAVELDPPGPTTFDVPADEIRGDGPADWDYLKDHPNAPDWVRNWAGPYTCRVENVVIPGRKFRVSFEVEAWPGENAKQTRLDPNDTEARDAIAQIIATAISTVSRDDFNGHDYVGVVDLDSPAKLDSGDPFKDIPSLKVEGIEDPAEQPTAKRTCMWIVDRTAVIGDTIRVRASSMEEAEALARAADSNKWSKGDIKSMEHAARPDRDNPEPE